MPQYIGLVGYPLKHSISPAFQQAGLDYYHLDIRYEAWEREPARLREVVNDLRKHQNIGANVTVPHKEAVVPLLDAVDELAGCIGAVNTIVKRGDRLVGFNTDAYGLMEALEKEGRFAPEGRRVLLLGAGGVARAAGFVLVQRKAASLHITDGIFERASVLARALVSHVEGEPDDARIPKPNIEAFRWEKLSDPRTVEGCDLIVHCTTIGMKDSSQEGQSPLRLDVIPKNALVFDVVYNPQMTPLLRLAERVGANILGGLPMLVYQGAASFKLWTGKEPPVDIMLASAKEALTGGKT